jgi:DNA-binding response OmpR family regulator
MNNTPKILIVDDELIIRITLESLLAAEDVEIIFAENGEQGLLMARKHQPDAILLDIMMPGIDGYETCRQIRATPTLAETHIIMITALDDRNARLVGLLAGADDFLTKPFDGFELQVRIKNIIRINRYRNLIAERSRFNWVVEKAEKGYLLLDECDNIQYANELAQVYLHLSPEYINVNFEEQAAQYYQSHFQNGDPGEDAGYFVQPESATARAFWLRFETLNNPSGKENQRLICLRDVTDEMSAYHDVRKMNMVVAHKLRTPANLMYSAMHLLNTQMDALPAEEIRAIVKTAWKGSERLAQEIQGILKYIDAPMTLSKGKPIPLSEVCALANSIADAMNLKKVDISLPETLAEQKLGITTNAMELIIYEILGNSQKFHPTNEPHVQIEISVSKTQDILLRFSNNSPCMTAEQLNLATKPYLQGEKWFTGEMPGLGLGIPLVASLVWQSKGKFRIANRPDQNGICITLELPVLL